MWRCATCSPVGSLPPPSPSQSPQDPTLALVEGGVLLDETDTDVALSSPLPSPRQQSSSEPPAWDFDVDVDEHLAQPASTSPSPAPAAAAAPAASITSPQRWVVGTGTPAGGMEARRRGNRSRQCVVLCHSRLAGELGEGR